MSIALTIGLFTPSVQHIPPDAVKSITLLELARILKLDGIMYFTDPKLAEHCVFFTRKAT